VPTDDTIGVELVCAWPDEVFLQIMQLPAGSSVTDALHACELGHRYPELDLACMAVGIHGRKVGRDQVLRDGDRVEVYRPLRIDPMQARRQRARRDAD